MTIHIRWGIINMVHADSAIMTTPMASATGTANDSRLRDLGGAA